MPSGDASRVEFTRAPCSTEAFLECREARNTLPRIRQEKLPSMSSAPTFDATAAHRWYSATFFNQTWDLIDKADRSADENQQMVELCLASIAHWRLREDCKPVNLSIGYWLAARVHSLIGRADEALRYAWLSLEKGREQGAFFEGYAHEAIARAARLSGNETLKREHLDRAQTFLAQIDDEQSCEALRADLESLA